eukprot:CAMPEP_0195533030 /NCGR_PEP_ID=MMETSP0794_2-20130614/39659_1 /TAXON_ID=515487 /ORGANISM="Stephanopyxis turris, Strain CCMP 815" /LENGTH=351 /DNA_ID=CAMNT_0040665433 /DNA_START=96 /DNA_END=1151 /DNA_ORIENTATION=+
MSSMDVEAPKQEHASVQEENKYVDPQQSDRITSTGLKVLILLAFQNCTKNLLTRYVMKDAPNFLYSAAVIGSELTKLTLSTLYILLIDKRSISSIGTFLRGDVQNTKLLIIPACVYNMQQTLELVALENIHASIFSVLVQSKLIMTAVFSVIVLRKQLRKAQVISLVLLTVGVVLCNMEDSNVNIDFSKDSSQLKGIIATLGIAVASGFAAVYTEKVIKKKRTRTNLGDTEYSLAYMQVQLAGVSLIVMGAWAILNDYDTIVRYGLWHNFELPAFIAVFNAGVGGLMVAACLKYADSVLKGYATAVSVVLTGILSMVIFDTTLNILYGLGIVNVIAAVFLYNATDLEKKVF